MIGSLAGHIQATHLLRREAHQEAAVQVLSAELAHKRRRCHRFLWRAVCELQHALALDVAPDAGRLQEALTVLVRAAQHDDICPRARVRCTLVHLHALHSNRRVTACVGDND